MAHGRYDEVLPLEIGQLSKSVLLSIGAKVEWHEYSTGHQLCDQQIADIGQWIVSILDRN